MPSKPKSTKSTVPNAQAGDQSRQDHINFFKQCAANTQNRVSAAETRATKLEELKRRLCNL